MIITWIGCKFFRWSLTFRKRCCCPMGRLLHPLELVALAALEVEEEVCGLDIRPSPSLRTIKYLMLSFSKVWFPGKSFPSQFLQFLRTMENSPFSAFMTFWTIPSYTSSESSSNSGSTVNYRNLLSIHSFQSNDGSNTSCSLPLRLSVAFTNEANWLSNSWLPCSSKRFIIS